MKVIAVYGSPRRDGKSQTIVRRIADGAREAGHEVVEYFISKMNVKGCQACYYCKQHNSDCIVADDLLPYWKDLHECGALIVSAPNYASGICGPMVSFMNRHYCVVDEPRNVLIPHGIKLIGVFAQNREDENEYMDNYEWFLSDFERRKMILQDTLVATKQTSVEEDSPMMQRAYALGKAL